MAKIIDGKAYAERLRARIAKAVQELKAKHGLMPGPRRGAGRRRPGQQGLCRQQGQADRRGRHELLGAQASRLDARRPIFSPSSTSSTTIPPATAFWCNCRCPSTSIPPRCSTPSIPPRMSTAFTWSMSASSPPARTRSCRARRSARVMLAKDVLGKLEGLEAVVIGRSNIVGKPVAQLLLAENCTVTIAHSRTRDLARRRPPRRSRHRRRGPARNGQGRLAEARLPASSMSASTASSATARRRLVGDCDFASCEKVAGLDHAGSRRRRPDDHRLPAPQHRARGVRAEGNSYAGDVTLRGITSLCEAQRARPCCRRRRRPAGRRSCRSPHRPAGPWLHRPC